MKHIRSWLAIFALLLVEAVLCAADMREILGNDPDVFFDIDAKQMMDSKEYLQGDFGSYFQWADRSNTAIHYGPSRSGGISAFGRKLIEAKITFSEGKIAEISYLFYSRGDAGEISKDDFDSIVKVLTENISLLMDCKPTTRRERMMKNTASNCCVWVSERTSCFLRWSARGGHANYKPEFISVRFEPFDPKNDPRKSGYNVQQKKDVIKGKGNLKNNVATKEDGTVFVDNIPMVDQGPKGYCVVAVMERLLRYYGNDTLTQHDFANMAKTQTTGGTNVDNLKEVVRKAGSRMGVKIRDEWSLFESVPAFEMFVRMYNKKAAKTKRGQVKTVQRGNTVYINETTSMMDPKIIAEIRRGEKQEYKKFKKAVMASIDNGIPVVWSVNMSWDPANSHSTRQSGDGHMRLIIGYNEENDKIIYSDSWGAGHEFKVYDSMRAWVMTTGYIFIEPR